MSPGVFRAKRYLLLLTVIQFFSAMATLIYFAVQINNNHSYHQFISQYQEQKCTPVSSYIQQLSNCPDGKTGAINETDGWIMTWRDEAGRIIVEDPFEAKNILSDALDDRNDVQLFLPRRCVCRSPSHTNDSYMSENYVGRNCEVWETCILNVNFFQYLQLSDRAYFLTNISFIVGSGITMIFSFVTTILTLQLLGKSARSYNQLPTE